MHSLRQTSSRLLKPSRSNPFVLSRLQCAPPRSTSIVLSTQTPVISTRLVRWKSSTNTRSKKPQQDPEPSLSSKIQYPEGFRPEYDLTPEENQAYRNIHSEAEQQDDVDYVDLYAKSRAAEETNVTGREKQRSQQSGERPKPKSKPRPKDQGHSSTKSTTHSADSLAATKATERPKTPSQRLSRAEVPHETVYVGNLFFDIAAEDLRAHFEQFGTVLSTTIVHDNRGISKGFGYVQFSTVEEAKTAVEKQHMKVLGGRQVVLQYARNNIKPMQEEHEATNTLYVGNIAYEMTDRDLQDLFSDVVNTFDIRVPIHRRTGMLRGFIHVEFLNVEAARIGKEVLARKAPYGRKLDIQFTHLKRRGMMHSEGYDDGFGQEDMRSQGDNHNMEERPIVSEPLAARLTGGHASDDGPRGPAER